MSKHAIIVGVGPGIGLSLVETFANEGFFVTMMSRSQERLINYKNSLKEQGLNVDARVLYRGADMSDFYRANIPLKRAGLSEEIADSILYFASDRSSYVSGQVLAVDGGMTIKMPTAGLM